VRGLDAASRRAVLATVRRRFVSATLLFVSHDIDDTLGFDRVLVAEGGRIVEDGAPRDLAGRAGSRYHQLLESHRRVQRQIWRGSGWRHVTVERGAVVEGPPR
jgi:ATP-binding cassette subfamily B protein